ncbi:hypothetical protein CDD83_1241 [Cordyceps sp. RAO-2017]|nr:hypothetical protein CDD83_1241 [Cordyceps sp. RAO-2017]
MELDSQHESTTPPHHPTAGVRLRSDQIRDIVRAAVPGAELISVTPLPSGRSFNNRIYFLALRHRPSGLDPRPLEEEEEEQPLHEAVLKVNGRFFGGLKVQNEVACLLLLHRHCPHLPVPRALAWSEDGLAVTRAPVPLRAASPPDAAAFERATTQATGHGGWILMTRLPGEPLTSVSLDDDDPEEAGAGVAAQLADMVATWRHQIPAQRHCGNVGLGRAGHGTDGLEIRGFLADGIESAEPVAGVNAFYRLRLADRLHELESAETYAPNRRLAAPLRAFMAETLPHLALADQQPSSCPAGGGPFFFTHYDLSPRNVLVSGRRPLRVTGVVDFEFAGFLTPLDEFLNDHVGNGGDWPAAFYQDYLERLERRGVATPLGTVRRDVWNRCLWLETLLTSIAPWELPGGLDEAELVARLARAELVVRSMLERLRRPAEQHWEPPARYGEAADAVNEGVCFGDQ